MKLVRGTIRLIAFTFATAAFASLCLAGRFGSQQEKLALRNWIFRKWARTVIRLLNIKVEITYRGPQAPFLLVTNHLSYIDIVVLASQLDCTFIAKSEVARWPVIGALSRLMNTVFINRKQKRDVVRVMDEIQKLIESGLGVVLFAEGTSTAGRHVSPFKPSLLEFAASRNIPVHYASITYATNCEEAPANQSVCWWGDMTFPDHFFRLLQLSSFAAKVTYGPEPIVAGDRRVLATELWHAVNAQFTPVTVN